MTVFIDADGCPVVDITVKLSAQAKIKCVIICDTSHVFDKPGATTITVSQGSDSVDFALVNMVEKGDVVVTQDYGLAAMSLARGAVPVNQDGMVFTNDNIDSLLMQRHVSKKLRASGIRQKSSSKRTSEQNKLFEAKLKELLSSPTLWQSSLTETVRALPLTPGCYFFKDKRGDVLYIGKSKCLRKRVSSYFTGQNEQKIAQMMNLVASVSHVCTATDIEAILLEHRLIKQYLPPFNAKMRITRKHWYIDINVNPPYPILRVVPHEARNPLWCVGPFSHQDSAFSMIKTVADYWRIPVCGKENGISGKGPCLQYHIGFCLGPCSENLPDNAYSDTIREMSDFFQGHCDGILRKVKNSLQEASDALAYEKAAKLRNQYEAFSSLAWRMERMPPDFDGREFCVWLKSHHEDSILLAHISDCRVKAYARFANDENIKGSDGFAAMMDYLETGKTTECENFLTFNETDGEALIKAIIETEAERRFVDITDMRYFAGANCVRPRDTLVNHILLGYAGEN